MTPPATPPATAPTGNEDECWLTFAAAIVGDGSAELEDDVEVKEGVDVFPLVAVCSLLREGFPERVELVPLGDSDEIESESEEEELVVVPGLVTGPVDDDVVVGEATVVVVEDDDGGGASSSVNV